MLLGGSSHLSKLVISPVISGISRVNPLITKWDDAPSSHYQAPDIGHPDPLCVRTKQVT